MELGSLVNSATVQIPPNSIKKQFTFTSTFKGSIRFFVVFDSATGNVDGVFLKNDLIMQEPSLRYRREMQMLEDH